MRCCGRVSRAPFAPWLWAKASSTASKDASSCRPTFSRPSTSPLGMKRRLLGAQRRLPELGSDFGVEASRPDGHRPPALAESVKAVRGDLPAPTPHHGCRLRGKGSPKKSQSPLDWYRRYRNSPWFRFILSELGVRAP